MDASDDDFETLPLPTTLRGPRPHLSQRTHMRPAAASSSQPQPQPQRRSRPAAKRRAAQQHSSQAASSQVSAATQGAAPSSPVRPPAAESEMPADCALVTDPAAALSDAAAASSAQARSGEATSLNLSRPSSPEPVGRETEHQSPPPPSPSSTASELACPVCCRTATLISSPIQDHVNRCLDGRSGIASNVPEPPLAASPNRARPVSPQDALGGLFLCPICSVNLTSLSAMQREAHTNRCLDESASSTLPSVIAPDAADIDPDWRIDAQESASIASWTCCILCEHTWQPAMPLARRALHLKSCARARSVSPAELLRIVRTASRYPAGAIDGFVVRQPRSASETAAATSADELADAGRPPAALASTSRPKVFSFTVDPASEDRSRGEYGATTETSDDADDFAPETVHVRVGGSAGLSKRSTLIHDRFDDELQTALALSVSAKLADDAQMRLAAEYGGLTLEHLAATGAPGPSGSARAGRKTKHPKIAQSILTPAALSASADRRSTGSDAAPAQPARRGRARKVPSKLLVPEEARALVNLRIAALLSEVAAGSRMPGSSTCKHLPSNLGATGSVAASNHKRKLVAIDPDEPEDAQPAQLRVLCGDAGGPRDEFPAAPECVSMIEVEIGSHVLLWHQSSLDADPPNTPMLRGFERLDTAVTDVSAHAHPADTLDAEPHSAVESDLEPATLARKRPLESPQPESNECERRARLARQIDEIRGASHDAEPPVAGSPPAACPDPASVHHDPRPQDIQAAETADAYPNGAAASAGSPFPVVLQAGPLNPTQPLSLPSSPGAGAFLFWDGALQQSQQHTPVMDKRRISPAPSDAGTVTPTRGRIGQGSGAISVSTRSSPSIIELEADAPLTPVMLTQRPVRRLSDDHSSPVMPSVSERIKRLGKLPVSLSESARRPPPLDGSASTDRGEPAQPSRSSATVEQPGTVEPMPPPQPDRGSSSTSTAAASDPHPPVPPSPFASMSDLEVEFAATMAGIPLGSRADMIASLRTSAINPAAAGFRSLDTAPANVTVVAPRARQTPPRAGGPGTAATSETSDTDADAPSQDLDSMFTSPAMQLAFVENMHARLLAFVRSNEGLHQRVLTFEPLDFDALFGAVLNVPELSRCTRKVLTGFLDKHGISFRGPVVSPTKNRRRHMRSRR
ncbi:5'-flap endonuclease [Polyrhizophydium stewartii]|uniref:Structure-specific endonuclease subunit SLX4 n=1 Tax=Polyrhizophydium stewartii TaxID=2732419 RepID=A0ABR4NER7_9FUNG